MIFAVCRLITVGKRDFGHPSGRSSQWRLACGHPWRLDGRALIVLWMVRAADFYDAFGTTGLLRGYNNKATGPCTATQLADSFRRNAGVVSLNLHFIRQPFQSRQKTVF